MNHDDLSDDIALEELTMVEESFSSPTLSVMVDFNDLLSDQGESHAFELIGKLKDLLA